VIRAQGRQEPRHPDLTVDGGDVEAGVRRLLELGATRAGVGQKGDGGFTVPAGPDRNGFRLLHRASAD
jgi:Glyoxalase-like domain